MNAIELLKRYKLVELAVLYSRRKGCKARDKMLKVCVDNLSGIVDRNTEIEILARMIKAVNKFLNYEEKCCLYEDVLIRLDNGVRKTVNKYKVRKCY